MGLNKILDEIDLSIDDLQYAIREVTLMLAFLFTGMYSGSKEPGKTEYFLKWAAVFIIIYVGNACFLEKAINKLRKTIEEVS